MKRLFFLSLRKNRELLFLIVFIFSCYRPLLTHARFLRQGEVVMAIPRNTIGFSDQGNASKPITIRVNLRNVTVEKIFYMAEEKWGINFIYDKSILKDNTRFTLNESDISLSDLLNKIERQSGFKFKKINNNIYVKVEQRETKPVSSVMSEHKADIVVSGRVTDQHNNPIPQVSVLVDGTSKGTATDVEGRYSISVAEDAVLRFSTIGYSEQRVLVKNQQIINVTLMESLADLEEVVVVGYGAQKRSDVTGAIGSVTATQIKEEPVLQVGQALQGKVAGLQVSQNSGAPGSGLLIRVRGTGTVNNAEPLYVIDGNPNSNPLDLAPDQIENIQVLKSASAAAIYGAQGANGVILITTKQGTAGKTQLDINFSQGLQQIQRHLPMTNAREYAILYNEGLTNAGDKPLYPDPDALGTGTDWQKEVFRVAPMTDLSVSTSGGGEHSKFYLSGGYQNQEGIIRGSAYDRLNLRINSSHNITKGIKIGQNLFGSLARYQQIGEFGVASTLSSVLTANPEVPVYMPDGSWGYSETSLNSSNPLASIHYTHNDTRRPVLNGNVYTDITILKDLVFRSQFNFNIGYTENTVFNPIYRISAANFNEVASLTENTTRLREHSWANTLTYQKTFGKHSFDLLGGITTQESYTQYTLSYAAGLPAAATDNPNLRHFDLATQGNRVEGNAGEWGILSYLGRLNYNYAGKYFTTINFRVDGSSKFGENNRYGYFPSFSVGWKLSEESFLSGVEFIDNLMLRGGWGSLGNQGSLPNYAFANLVTPNINYTFGLPQRVIRGQAPIGLGNPDLKWEATKETNLGLDFSGFGGKMIASFDYYHKKTTDMLLQVPIAEYTGIQNFPYVNGGDVVNKGIEFSLGYENTSSGGFTYSISGNMAFNKNKVTQLSNDGSSIYQWLAFIGNMNVTQVGSPIASFYGWKTDGIFQTQEEVDNHAFQSSGTAPGDIRFMDLNGDNIINAEDQTLIGNPWPKFTYGLTSNFSYKGFDLRIQLQGVYGNDIFMGLRFRTEGSNFFNYTKNVWDHRWTGPGTSNDVPRMNTNDPNNNMRSSDYYIESGSYLRVRNIQLGYRVPQRWIKLRAFRVYASVQNAFTISNYPGFDPEIGTNRESNPLYIGIDEANYPVPRIYTFGVSVGI